MVVLLGFMLSNLLLSVQSLLVKNQETRGGGICPGAVDILITTLGPGHSSHVLVWSGDGRHVYELLSMWTLPS